MNPSSRGPAWNASRCSLWSLFPPHSLFLILILILSFTTLLLHLLYFPFSRDEFPLVYHLPLLGFSFVIYSYSQILLLSFLFIITTKPSTRNARKTYTKIATGFPTPFQRQQPTSWQSCNQHCCFQRFYPRIFLTILTFLFENLLLLCILLFSYWGYESIFTEFTLLDSSLCVFTLTNASAS